MTLITPPAALPIKKDSIRKIAPSRVNTSVWTGSRQVEILPGARFGFDIEFAPRQLETDAKAWRAFFAELNGVSNTFRVYPEVANQTANNNGLVAGASQTGYSLNIDGLSNPAGTGLVPGDWATVTLPNKGDQLLMLTSITEGNDGTATINFWPALRESPADNAAVQLQNPWAEVANVNDVDVWERSITQFHQFTFSVQEVW